MEERPDLISSLPDEILHRIISMVSFTQAIQASTLSSSWRRVIIKPFLANVDFDGVQSNSQEGKEKLRQILESFLKSNESFQTLKIYLDSCDFPFAIGTKGSHGELHLHFLGEKLSIPCKFNLILEPGSLICPTFSSVKTLYLRSVSHFVGNLVNDLFLSCQFLESFKLEKCIGLENLVIKSNGYLQNFVIADCPNIARLTLSAQNLKSFSYQGVFTDFQLNNTPHLVDFTLNLKDYYSFDCEDVLSLLSSVKDVEILTISSWLIEALCSAGVIFSSLDFQFSKLKELWCVDSKVSSKMRDSLACFLNTTPSLEKLVVKIEQNSSHVECPFVYNYQCWHEPHLWKDYATVKSNACQLKQLKIIELIGFAKEKDELLLMDLLLHKAINLKEMTVTSPQNDSWRVARTPFSHLKYMKSKYVLISCPDTGLYFVLIEAKTMD